MCTHLSAQNDHKRAHILIVQALDFVSEDVLSTNIGAQTVAMAYYNLAVECEFFEEWAGAL